MRRVVVIALLFVASSGQGQSLYNNASLISISAAAVLYVKDTIVNNGTMINNGEVLVGGSWMNNAQYQAGQGAITFHSNLPQVINHNDQSFSKLTIDGGGEKLFLADIIIEDELHLSDGILVSGNNARIIFSPVARVTGGSDFSHIQGPVYHRGPGNKLFPLGNGALYLPVELHDVQGSSPEVGVRLSELQRATLLASASLEEISSNRYWELDIASGSLSSSRARLPVRQEAIVPNAGEAVVAQAGNPAAAFESLGRGDFQATADGGYVLSEKFVTMPLLAVGTASPDRSLVVYNAISANGDGLNDFLIIGNIENYPDNKFTLFNRWGDKVFEIDRYDNRERVFRGKSNVAGEQDLVNGTYFYVIESQKGALKINGFLALKN